MNSSTDPVVNEEQIQQESQEQNEEEFQEPIQEEEEDLPLFKNFRTNPVLEDHSPATVYGVIGAVNNSITSFAILSRPSMGECSPILTSVTEKHGFWESEKILVLACWTDRDIVNVAICKDSILLSGGDVFIVHKLNQDLTCITSMKCSHAVSLPGIGFDASTGNYKVVRLLSHSNVQILTTYVNSPGVCFERLIKNDLTDLLLHFDEASPIYTDGVISWLIQIPHHTNAKAILCFHVASESFKLYQVPSQATFGDDLQPSDCVYFHLVSLEERICVCTHNVRKARVNIWMMKEKNNNLDEREIFWMREYSVDVGAIQYCDYQIVPVHVDRYRIFFGTLAPGLVCYDKRTQKFTTVYSSGALCSSFDCVAYE